MPTPIESPSQTVDYLKRLARWSLDMIFPPRCLGCRTYLFKYPMEYLCTKCESSISINHGFECIECKAPVSLGVPCLPCRQHTAIDQLLIATDFKDPLIQRLIKTYKYKFIPEISLPLGRIITQYITFLALKKSYRIFQDNPLIIPVPLHPYRLNWRGFNQSSILAKQLADSYQMEMNSDVLIRSRHTQPQATTENREARIMLTQDLFACSKPDIIEGRPILLIDDVCTSGATLNACAKILKQSGAKNVYALVVARG